VEVVEVDVDVDVEDEDEDEGEGDEDDVEEVSDDEEVVVADMVSADNRRRQREIHTRLIRGGRGLYRNRGGEIGG
jgi:hypothetical protein